MRSARAAVAAIIGTTLALPGPVPATAGDGVPEIERILADERLAGATVVAEVRDEDTGELVFARDPDRRVLPASNQKLLTAAAALEVLGPSYQFRTSVRHTGPVAGGVLRGDLYLVGQGDPTMTYERYDALAAAVAEAGVTEVEGRVLADDGWFDRVPLGLDWSWQDEGAADTAPVSAVSFAAGERFDNAAVEVRYRPGVAGKAPVVGVHPPTATVRLLNRAVSGSANTVTVSRDHGTRRIVVGGVVSVAGSKLVSVPDPAATSLDLFGAALKRHGIAFGARTGKGSAPETAATLTAQVSDPLAEILPAMLKLSNNGLAEMLVKAMSRAVEPTVPGSWPGGLAAMSEALGRLGADPGALTPADGSGLSRRNGVTARQLTTVLAAARRKPWFGAWYAALPVAADPDPMTGGTLRDRMRGTPAAGNARAKTGTLAGVNALSGYVTGADGRRMVFSLIVNGAAAGVSDLLDHVVIALARTETVLNGHYRSVGDRANARPPIPQPRHPRPAVAAAARAADRARGAHPARRAAGTDAAHLVRGALEPARGLHA
ncbi:D-alanyl-D-alanine carboxypeptidase/D-alanyl-D-alanine-endopeptidase [Actinoplanes sp. NPDC051861]|uniref:D-alanyl-D-alanine carboxypeptidase/D-alanyl-D-alanine endopeptidase n=1 Tax=Actinoplanes sp. NPDC051861 TaxID=3155170 RepID=UPI00341CEAF3